MSVDFLIFLGITGISSVLLIYGATAITEPEDREVKIDFADVGIVVLLLVSLAVLGVAVKLIVL